MRSKPPHRLIKYRHALLGLALLGWLVAAVTLALFKGGEQIPVNSIVAVSGLIFAWANGFYWWVILRYPYIEVSTGTYASHDEQKKRNSLPFLIAYTAGAIFASISCMNLALAQGAKPLHSAARNPSQAGLFLSVIPSRPSLTVWSSRHQQASLVGSLRATHSVAACRGR